MKERIVSQLKSRLREICPEATTIPSVGTYNGIERESEWSLQIAIPEEVSTCDYLKYVFGISNPDWGELYRQAVSGSGKEEEKITTLHSSSLLAFLCFANITEENPLRIAGTKYTKVWLEVKNRVFDNPSNIDIVLGNGGSDFLFIESKFTEYLTPANKAFAKKYFNFYQKILPMIDGFPLQMVYPRPYNQEDGMGLKCSSDAKLYSHLYMDGIKQCFSHLIGLCQGPYGKDSLRWGNIDGKIRFAEILYRFPGDAFKCYSAFYSKTIGSLNAEKLGTAIDAVQELENNNTDRIEILPEVLTYQDVFKDYSLPKKVKRYFDL